MTSWASDYITTAELKAFVRVADATDDTELGLIATAVSREIDTFCNRQFGKASSAGDWFYSSEWLRDEGRYRVVIDDLVDTTGLELHVDTDRDGTYSNEISSSYYTLRPKNAPNKGLPYTEIVIHSDSPYLPPGCSDDVKVVMRPGWDAVPSIIATAARLQGSRIVTRRDSPLGVAGASVEGEIRLLSKLDPDVELMIGSLRRRTGAVL